MRVIVVEQGTPEQARVIIRQLRLSGKHVYVRLLADVDLVTDAVIMAAQGADVLVVTTPHPVVSCSGCRVVYLDPSTPPAELEAAVAKILEEEHEVR